MAVPNPNTPWRSKADPRTLELRFSRLGGVWYLQWFTPNSLGGKPLAQRKAHDTECRLIEQVVELRKRLLPEMRGVADLKLKPMVGLKTWSPTKP